MLNGLMGWFEPRRRAYPWRRPRPDPYAVLVSEVMLQQTQASRVAPKFERFMRSFPTLDALAAAPAAEVVRAWAGLGYNRRALALWEAARTIVSSHGGRVPDDPSVLSGMPGVGPYTAAAVASIAYGQPVAAVDTNVRRVLARAVLGVEPDVVAPDALRAAAVSEIDRRDPGGWNQALMDLGREVCRPAPRCEVCPLARRCRFAGRGARPTGSRRRQPPFRGSFRELRGRVVEAVRAGPTSIGALSRLTGRAPVEVGRAVAALEADGLIAASRGAASGHPGGRVRLR